MFGRILPFFLVLTAIAACGPDERPTNNIQIANNNPNNTTNNTTGTNNSNNVTIINNGFGEECLGVECAGSTRCVRGVCVDMDLKVSCEEPDDLGVLTFGETFTGTGNTTPYVDAIKTTCSDDGVFSGAEYAVRFTVEEAGEARFTISSDEAIDWLIEVREDCADPGMDLNNEANSTAGPAPAQCVNTDSMSFALDPGRDYWVIVEPATGIDKGAFDWELELTQPFCDRGRTCMDATTILHCFAGVEERVESCGTPCLDGVCQGDSCADAVVVTGSMSWSGDANAFTDTLNFEGQPSCSADGVDAYSTPGPELVLSLPGLTAGQRVIVDASMMDDNDNAIFLLDSCTDQAPCVGAADLGDVLQIDVPADGDYFVVIDKFTSTTHTFNYTIDIQ